MRNFSASLLGQGNNASGGLNAAGITGGRDQGQAPCLWNQAKVPEPRKFVDAVPRRVSVSRVRRRGL
jgi:hypothetical protein